MSAFIEIDHVDKIFPLADGGQYIALKNIELKIKQGEFVSLIGHSGCGKSTLLNIVNAGFEVLRLQMNVKQTTMKVTFGQDFIEPPVVLAGADAYAEDYAAFVDDVTTSGCTIRLVKIKDKLGKAHGKTEYVNIIAVGKTRD